MGLAEALLGKDNPFAKFVGENRNTIRGFGAGLAQGPNFSDGLSAAVAGGNRMAPLDDAMAEQRRMAEEQAQQKNQTLEYLAGKFPDLAAAVQGGAPLGEAWGEAMARLRPATGGGDAFTLGPGETRFGPDGSILAAGGPAGSADKPPASVAEYEYAKAAGYTGSYLDFEKEKKAAGRAPLDAGSRKELFEADEAAAAGGYVLSALDEAMSLTDKAYDGPFAAARGDATALMGDEAGIATSRLKNITTELALTQLKTIFGGMPTEGERKILLEMQGSVDMPKAVRADIYKRAKALAERRIAENKAKAEALRSGVYFDPGYGSAPGMGGSPPADVDAILKGLGL